jgi:hypothetical protein
MHVRLRVLCLAALSVSRRCTRRGQGDDAAGDGGGGGAITGDNA